MKLAQTLLAFAVLAAPAGLVAAPSVSNVAFVQESDGAGQTRVRVTYDLATPNGPSAVSLLHSLDGGATYLPTTSTTGAVGAGITTGTAQTIDWAVATDLPGQQISGNFRVRVLAEDGVAIPLDITSNGGAVHQLATQTLTFTFAEAVTGFDASDVVVVNGTKGAFTPVSASVYTLNVTSPGGTVTASVSGGAATAASGTGNATAGDTFSNFYQDTWTITLPGSVPMELIRIPAGTFTMGSPVGELSRGSDETPHQVTLSQDFYLGKTEVTQNQWTALQSFPTPQIYVGGTMPVHNVSHNDIGSWLTALDTATTEPGTFSLPTESQWEYAARAGTTTRFNFGNGFGGDENCSAEAERTNNMWYCGNNLPDGTKVVGQKPANAWGLRDMHGNVWEWCADWYDTYPGTVTDPTGPVSGLERVIRGGAWGIFARFCRSAQRASWNAADWSDNIGFRVLAVRPVPLTITSSETAPAHQSATQTLTFTFAEPVTGFDASDISLTNATAGTFTPVSSTVYTLGITAVAPGAVTATVAANAAVENSASYVGTEGKSFSNTFDTTAPTVSARNPASGATIGAPSSVVVTLTEPVLGLTAGQLTVGGSPATSVTGNNPYTFSGFTAPGLGTTTVALASGSAADAAGNALVADSWNYTVIDSIVSLAITSTLAEGSISATQNQTLTFTFGLPVTGFDTSDVTVTNGTKGTFTPVSPTVYTLEVSGLGGTVSASVVAGAALAAVPFTTTAADSYSNFYQDTWTITLPGSVPMELIRIPAGTFTMGSPVGELSRGSNEAQHTVTLTQDFYLGKTEVTQAQWTAIYGSFPDGGQSHGTGAGSETRAVHRVSHNDIMNASTGFMKLLNDHVTEPGTFSLPTEAQWEYACRAGTTTRFNFGDGFAVNETIDTGGGRGDNMWFDGNSGSSTQLVGQKPANPWGLRDMHGNVWEWCADWYGPYDLLVTENPTGPATGSDRVLRGGSWDYGAGFCRSAQRVSFTPILRGSDVGLRVAAVRPVSLTITSSETAPVHQTATQTLTFTFGEPVTGFDASDVSLTNATAGTFTPVSSTVYTLGITAVANGAVTAAVAANAAVESSVFYIGTEGKSFSNTWDSVAPSVTSTNPANAAVIPPPTSIVVTFSETVMGLTAGQLTVNGSPATTVTGTNPYTFSGFAEPGTGGLAVAVALAAGSTTDAAGNPFAGASWGYTTELLRFVSVPAGTFTMGRSNVGDDATLGGSDELPNHEVTLSAYDIGKFEVTNAQFATVMNWALAQGYLANDTSGAAYAGAGTVYLMAPDSTATRQTLFDTSSFTSASSIEWTGSAFAARTRESLSVDPPPSMAEHPVVRVSWFGAVAFCNFLAEMEGKPLAYNTSTWELVDADAVAPGLQYVASYRLPTESEWERAAAWDGTRRWTYSFVSDTLTGSARANYDAINPFDLNGTPRTSPVGWFNGVNISPRGAVQTIDSPSPVGAYDMSGNVAEWCHDWFGSYTATPKTNPTGPEASEIGTLRRVRGGSAESNPNNTRTARRWTNGPAGQFGDVGFRVLAIR